ncbi:MAG: LysE family transporter [Hungatella hathewayi]|nr:LysE family transporter [Hungatella hathewayi]
MSNYLLKGLVIGVVFGVPAGVVGVLSIQRVLTQGAFAGLMTGIGSSVADVFYACVGVFGITFISDFLLKHQSVICMAGCLMVIAIGVRTIRKKESHSFACAAGNHEEEQPRHIVSCFLSSFVIAMTNPATILSFMVVFSMFRIGGNESLGENIQLVCGIFAGTCIWWLAIAVIVSLFRKKVADGFYSILNRIFGAFMILFGIVIGVRGCLPG